MDDRQQLLDAVAIQTLRECVEYSKQRVRDGNAPYELRTSKLQELDRVAILLRNLASESS